MNKIRIKLYEIGEDLGLVQMAEWNRCLHMEMWRKDSREYTAKELLDCLAILEKDKNEYFSKINK